jgi:ubiquinone/menaquinone biosynthesis C-methylase UbiE
MGLYGDHILPHLVDLAMRNSQFVTYRKRMLPLAQGRVLEIGMGSGLNLPFYSSEATEILGLEPHPKLAAMARRKHSPIAMTVLAGSAEFIPLENGCIDTAVMTWTLCSIPDAVGALREIRRVLRPGGQLLFVEHGMAPDERVSRWQRRLTPLWKRIAGGCHLDRAIPALVRQTGFEITHLETGYMQGPKAMTFMYEGRARSL